MDDIWLSDKVTVRQYKELENTDRKSIAQFVRERFNERYFDPMDSDRKHGFTIMAVCCLVIETLESFYRGEGDTKGRSELMFCSFFARCASLNEFGGGGSWFYKDIRCGLLHQSEARNGWRIRRDGPLLDMNERVINATLFMCELKSAVDAYANQLEHDDGQLWANFKKKMKAVCKNCVRNP